MTDRHPSQPFAQDAPSHGPAKGSGEYTIRQIIVEYKTLITVSVLMAVGAVLFTEISIEIPQWLKLYGAVASGAVLIGYIPGKWAVDRLYSRDVETVIDLDARDAEYAEYQFSPELFGELRVVGADTLASRRGQSGYLWFGRDVRYLKEGDRDTAHPLDGAEANSGEPVYVEADGWYVNGTWKASADDLELERERERIDEIRTKLEQEAMAGLAERIKMPGATRTAVREIVRVVLHGLERGTIHHGDDLQEITERVMRSYQMENLSGLSKEEAEEAHTSDERRPSNVGDMNIEDLMERVSADETDAERTEVPADD